MKHDTTYKVVLRKDKVKSNGQLPIYIRVTKHREVTYFSMGYSCYREEFNETEQRLYTARPRISTKDSLNNKPEELKSKKDKINSVRVNSKAATINADIDDKMDEVKRAASTIRLSKRKVSILSIREEVTDVNHKELGYLKFYKNYMESTIKVELKYNTYRNYRSTYHILLKYFKGKDFPLEQLTEDVLQEFKLWMINEQYKSETIKKYFKWMYAVWKQANKKRKLYDPFMDIKIIAQKPEPKDRLTYDEIVALQKLPLEGRLHDVRNMFLFAFFHAGVRISDVLSMKWQNVNNGKLNYVMKKNSKAVVMDMLPVGKDVIKEYRNPDAKDSDYIFKFLENGIDEASEYFEKQIQSKTTIINFNLKKLAKLLNTAKNLTTHVSRFSFADISNESNISAVDQSVLMKHSDYKTTQGYLKEDELKASKLIKRVLKNFKTLYK